MLKVAFFVEGQTERIFIEQLLDNYFTHPYFNVSSVELVSGKAKYVTKGNYDHDEVNLSFLIFDVQNDSKVLSAIGERANALKFKDYQFIIGIRDVYPAKREEIPIINQTFHEIIQAENVEDVASLILAIMEIEAWFLSDSTIFPRINNQLTIEWINNELNIDIENDRVEDYNHPAAILNSIFSLIGSRYRKRKEEVHNICHHIEYCSLCFDDVIHKKVPSLTNLIEKLNIISEN